MLRTFPTLIEADLAKSALESVGIDSMVRSDNKGEHTPGLAFSQGVELLVRAEDVTAANDMLGIEGLDSGNPELPLRQPPDPEKSKESHDPSDSLKNR